MSETLDVGGLHVVVRKSARRKTLGLTVERTGDVVLCAPSAADPALLSKWASRKLLWIHGRLAAREPLAARQSQPEYVAGESFGYLGRWYPLSLVTEQATPLVWDGSRFHLRRDAKPAALEHFRRWYVRNGKDWAEKRVRTLVGRVGVDLPDMRVRDLGYRWGSCAKSGTVFLNWKTLQLPVRLVDYVLVHELAHDRVHNHGPAFRALLDRSMPDWKARREELDRSAASIYWCGP